MSRNLFSVCAQEIRQPTFHVMTVYSSMSPKRLISNLTICLAVGCISAVPRSLAWTSQVPGVSLKQTTASFRSSSSLLDGHRHDSLSDHVPHQEEATSLDPGRRQLISKVSCWTTFAATLSATTKAAPAMTANAPPPASSSSSTEDSLDVFAKQLQQMDLIGATEKWPNSAISPLPKVIDGGSTAVVQNNAKTSNASASASDIQEALKEASKKRNVDPRTHG